MQSIGATAVVMDKFDPEAFLAAIERYKVTAVMVVPTMFIRLLGLPDAVRNRYDLSSLKTVIHAAAPCPVPVKHAMIEWLGPVIEEFYAGSEGNGHVMISSAEWLARPGSVGRAVVGQLHICDDDGNELPVGETGTIYFGGGKPINYHNDPAKSASACNPLHPDWTTMGDVGHVDDEGYLFLSDRKDFMIISGGVNIYPQEVENLLITHPAIADAAVFGVPNTAFGEEVKAVIQLKDWGYRKRRIGRRVDRLVQRTPRRRQMPAQRGLRTRTAPRGDGEVIQERTQGALLAGNLTKGKSNASSLACRSASNIERRLCPYQRGYITDN